MMLFLIWALAALAAAKPSFSRSYSVDTGPQDAPRYLSNHAQSFPVRPVHHPPEMKRIPLQAPPFSKRSLSTIQKWRDDDAAVGQDSILVEEPVADLIKKLKKAFPNLDSEQSEEPVGRFQAALHLAKKKALRVWRLVPYFGKDDDDDDLLKPKTENESKWAKMKLADAEATLGTNFQSGLNQDQVKALLAQHGLNVLDKPKSTPFWFIFLGACNTFIIYLMMVAIIYKFATREFIEASILTCMVTLLIIMGSVPEWDANRQADKLCIEEPVDVSVLRQSTIAGASNIPEITTIKSDMLVPGDIVYLSSGMRVPADCVVLEIESALWLSEAELTGEPESIQKTVRPDGLVTDSESTPDNLLLMGTCIEKGKCKAVVVETGMRARFGSIQKQLIMKERKATPISAKVDNLIWYFTWITVAIAILIGVLCIALKRRPDPSSDEALLKQVFVFTIALCIAVIPEGLAISCMLSLVKGKYAMLQSCQAMVRTMSAVECLSAIDVFCTDKTGTLTTGQMTVEGVALPDLATFFEMTDENLRNERLRRAMTISGICNSAEYHSDDHKFHGQMSDVALATAADAYGIDFRLKRIATNEFDSNRKMMSVVIENSGDAKKLFSPEAIDKVSPDAITEDAPDNDDQAISKSPEKPPNSVIVLVKGAPDMIIEVCDEIIDSNGEIRQKSFEDQEYLLNRTNHISEKGLRVLALAYRVVPIMSEYPTTFVEQGLVFVGLIAIKDPLRQQVPDTIKKFHDAWISVKMITGDSMGTAKAIGMEAGILRHADPAHSVKECDVLRKQRAKVDELKLKQLLLRYRRRADQENKLEFVNQISLHLKKDADQLIFDYLALAVTESDQGLVDHILSALGIALFEHAPHHALVGLLERKQQILINLVKDGVAKLWGSKELYELVNEAVVKLLAHEEPKLDDMVDETAVFARALPEDKVTIVEALQRRNHIVAMTGDGVNDAPALKKADAGIAVYTATGLTKRAAPINLLSDDFSLVAGLIFQGRRVAYNMVKAVFCMFGANAGELGPFFVQPFGFPSPLLTLQVLWVNAFTDVFNIVPLADDMPIRNLMLDKPIPVTAPVLSRLQLGQCFFMWILTTTGSIVSQGVPLRVLTGSFMGGRSVPKSAVWISTTSVMTFMVLSQLFFSFTCRDLTESVVPTLFTNRAMNIAVAVSTAVTLAVPYVPKLPGWLHMHQIPARLMALPVALSSSLALGHEVVKGVLRCTGVTRPSAPSDDDEQPVVDEPSLQN